MLLNTLSKDLVKARLGVRLLTGCLRPEGNLGDKKRALIFLDVVYSTELLKSVCGCL